MFKARGGGSVPVTERDGRPQPGSDQPGRGWHDRMSDNIAYALLVYTGLQIFMTMGALQVRSGSLLPYLALVVLVAAIIPACRQLETRWNHLASGQDRDPLLAPAFRRDRLALWLLAIGLPFALTGMFGLLAMVLGR